jgi:hypothetical protein
MVNGGRRRSLLASLALATVIVLWLAPASAGAAGNAGNAGTKALGGPGSQAVQGIAAVDGGFVAVGNETISGDTAPVVWRGSANGHVWKRSTHPQLPTPADVPLETSVVAVASSDADVVAVGSAEDNPKVHPPGGYPTAAVFWHATWAGALVLGTSDATGEAALVPPNWDFGQFIPTSVTFGNNQFVAGGALAAPSGNPACSHPLTWASTDGGSTWSVSALSFPSGGAGRVDAVSYDSASGFVAVGATYTEECSSKSTAALWRSLDGTTWQQYDLPEGSEARGVASSPDLVVVMGVGTKNQFGSCDAVFWTSVDLDSWLTTDDSTRERAIGALALADGSFLAYGAQCDKNGATFPLAYRKKPGGDWKPLQFDQPKKGTVLAAAPKGKNGFVMVGTEGDHGTAWWS